MRPLVWFRRDLRARDHRALDAACRAADDGVVGVFVCTPKQWQRHDDAPAKVHFWLENLRELSATLANRQIPLVIETVPTFDAVPKTLCDVAQRTGCDALYFNHEYEVNEQARDEATEALFEKHDLAVYTFHDRVVLPPAGIEKNDGGFYSVFTPYSRVWKDRVSDDDMHLLQLPPKQKQIAVTASKVPDNVDGYDFPSPRDDLWPAGEAAAKRRLRYFVDNQLDDYHQRRDIPSVGGTSLLSPYLAAGVLSPRQCLSAAVDANRGRISGGKKGADTWITELIWREFYTHVLVGFPRVCKHRPFQQYTDKIAWRDADEDFNAWQEGRTGYPIVDAAMRQLARTGWMHNRLRMVAAMFLTKHLLVDWRRGERHFMRHLVDGDLAANNGGWQWSASTGTDAAPYFRIFNPYSQCKKFDAEGKFIKKFCPELEPLRADALHDPEKLAAALSEHEIDYPAPIVEHGAARQRAIQAFKAVKSRDEPNA